MAKAKPEETEPVTADAPKANTPKLVKMVREGEPPNTADVHPDEVETCKRAGWRVAE